ncbi:MAG TPA: glycosyltransferase family 39 protein [Acidimicrobiales bacterium]|nr:glycosyltransferase family 39 protein [Acidimicrobiales bacterium]
MSDHPESGVITEDRNPTPDVMSGAPSPSVVDDAFAEPAVDGQPDEGDARRPDLVVWLHGLLRRQYTLPVLMVTVIGIVAMMNHFSGVDWGDDFALYMSQAKALNTGNIAEVVENTRYAVDNSGWNTFSPYLYPWGWPLLVAPVYAVFGLDYEAIKVLEVIALCVFLLVFYVLVRRRTGPVPATALTLLIGLSPSFVGATDTVLSDLPFLCFVGLTLWWMDQCRIRGILTCGRRDLLILGLLLAYAYNTRREGITLLIPLVALHLTVLAGRAGRPRSLGFLREVEWRPVLLPYATFAVTTIALHLALPSVLRPNAPGAGLQNASARLTYYKDVLAEHVGLKDFGQPMQLLGSQDAAALAVKALVALAIIGVVARLVHRFEEDLILASYLAGASLLMLVSPYQESRYLFTITPLLAYFAYQALPTLARLARLGEGMVSAASLVPLVALAGLLTYQFEDIKRSTDYHRVYHYTVNGPESPEAVEMLSTVRQMTRGDDVLLFFRARAMSLYTDRKAVQGSNLQQLLPRVDWYVMAKGSTYSQALLTDGDAAALGLTKTWENGGWVLWRVPSPAS